MKNFFFLILGIILVGGSIYLFLKQPVNRNHVVKVVKIANAVINVEVADTDRLRTQGLSGRTELIDGDGMLFIFEHPAQYGFWMKDMNFAIDMVWISESRHVVDIDREVATATFPQTFAPNEPVKYVLEVPSGFSQNNGIDIGSVVYFE